VLENVPQAGKDRLVSAASRLVNTLPIARPCRTRKAANEAGCEDAAGKIPFSRITRNAFRKIASDRGDSRAGDMRIGAGPDDLSDDHGQRSFSLGRDASYANRICSQRVFARKKSFMIAKVNV
jgi:hypothetical protein